jgi:hypothetical protein
MNSAGEVGQEMGKAELLQIVDHKRYDPKSDLLTVKEVVQEQLFQTLTHRLGYRNAVYQ